eukprot:11180975-Lingulodinium_polyedra.AAC.1
MGRRSKNTTLTHDNSPGVSCDVKLDEVGVGDLAGRSGSPKEEGGRKFPALVLSQRPDIPALVLTQRPVALRVRPSNKTAAQGK